MSFQSSYRSNRRGDIDCVGVVQNHVDCCDTFTDRGRGDRGYVWVWCRRLKAAARDRCLGGILDDGNAGGR